MLGGIKSILFRLLTLGLLKFVQIPIGQEQERFPKAGAELVHLWRLSAYRSVPLP